MKKNILIGLLFSINFAMAANIDNIKINKNIEEYKKGNDYKEVIKGRYFFKGREDLDIRVIVDDNNSIFSVNSFQRFNNDPDLSKCKKELIEKKKFLNLEYAVELDEKNRFRNSEMSIGLYCSKKKKHLIFPYLKKSYVNSSVLSYDIRNEKNFSLFLMSLGNDFAKKQKEVEVAIIKINNETHKNKISTGKVKLKEIISKKNIFGLTFKNYNSDMKIKEKDKISFFTDYKLFFSNKKLIQIDAIAKIKNIKECKKEVESLNREISLFYGTGFYNKEYDIFDLEYFPKEYNGFVTESLSVEQYEVVVNAYCKEVEGKINLVLSFRDKQNAKAKAINNRMKEVEEMNDANSLLMTTEKERILEYIKLKKSYIKAIKIYKYEDVHFQKMEVVEDSLYKIKEKLNKATRERWEILGKYDLLLKSIHEKHILEDKLEKKKKEIDSLMKNEKKDYTRIF